MVSRSRWELDVGSLALKATVAWFSHYAGSLESCNEMEACIVMTFAQTLSVRK